MIDRSLSFSLTQSPTYIDDALIRARRSQLEYHIDTGDFFLLLATLFGFLEETAADPESVPAELRQMQAELASTLRHDLQYLQQRYHIAPREA